MELSIFRDPPEDNLTIQIARDSHFDEVVSTLRCYLGDNSINYFEYVDEEDDNIIVRNNEDLESVYCFYFTLVEDSKKQGCPPPPLQIFPRVNVSVAPPLVHDLLQETNCMFSNVNNVFPTNNAQRTPPDTHMQSPVDSNTSNSGFLSSPEHLKTNLQNGANSVMHASDSFNNSVHESDVHFLGEMGHGNYGRVYRALHVPSQTVIAVKTIDLDLTEDIQRQIISELSILTSCHSPYIIEFYGSFFVGSSIHICTEFMDGSSLDNYGRVPFKILGRIAVHLVNGLEYLQQIKVLHRDVKPSNMLVNTRGECKLCDFGVSTQLVQSIAKTYTGTCAYMAPERLKGGEYRFAADVWSLGVSMYELLTGTSPFLTPGESISQIVPNLLMDRIVSTHSIPDLPESICPPEISSFISQCISMCPELRPTVEDMLQHALYKKYTMHWSNALIAQWVMEYAQDCNRFYSFKG